jgi:hypothetical protein
VLTAFFRIILNTKHGLNRYLLTFILSKNNNYEYPFR